MAAAVAASITFDSTCWILVFAVAVAVASVVPLLVFLLLFLSMVTDATPFPFFFLFFLRLFLLRVPTVLAKALFSCTIPSSGSASAVGFSVAGVCIDNGSSFSTCCSTASVSTLVFAAISSVAGVGIADGNSSFSTCSLTASAFASAPGS
eukprot:CAMPEP_0168235108 /NCGR_PEP_ID=MMETSP0140_2-20121125/18654_1 /TAXON_ID=44445 /ORGANISM="Pseudo-nitzschia australis, Strain 10249 10 AB" /LENGTH=149 /DNA_ID=CAMNT_0008168007 /DNA_START=110 /DNA_END=555 /DNA_ORIENTATION=+